MALPYSDDLRCKLLEAYEAGAGSLRELARQFRVSWGYSKKVRAHQVRTGSKQRVVQQRHGPPSRLSEAVQENLRAWLSAQPDLTEDELRERLAGSGVVVCKSCVGKVLRKMGMRRKKNAPCHRARHCGQPATTTRVPPTGQSDRAGKADLPR